MAEDRRNDHLSLDGNLKVAEMLKKLGQDKERVCFSDFALKINRKGKEQTRVMLITDKAMYNLLPDNYGKCKRRIPIGTLTAITSSSVSDEFVFHIPDEYDYRFKSAKKDDIFGLLSKLYKEQKSARLNIIVSEQPDLKFVAMTKPDAKLLSREERLQRHRELQAAEHESDNEDRKEVAKGAGMTQLMGGPQQKVKLEDFELLKVLGRGAFGKVMQVKKKDTGQIYAMKILKKKAIIQRNQVEHTNAERKVLQQLQHPFLMNLRFAFQSTEKLYLVLDYVNGGELFFHLKDLRRFPEEVARMYVAEIALALGHLHSGNTIYRDLKPENILLDATGHCCLTDFGLAKELEGDDKAHTFCGTPEYLAPEIIIVVGHDKMVDWWSLGILLYELVVGIPPFYSQNVNEMYNKIQHGQLRFPSFLSDDCKHLIVQFLNRDPSQRIGSKGDVEEIKAHPFFKGIDWQKLLRKEYEPGYKPKVKDKTEAVNFDEEFLSEPVIDSVVPESLNSVQNVPGAFNGFTFMPGQEPA
jgi:serum/glucocorticoid-regulated kinase 2